MSGKGPPATPAVLRAGVPHRVHDLGTGGVPAGPDSSYGAAAAAALGVDGARVFKTLLASVDGGLVVAVVPVAGTLDLKALAAAAGGRKAAMADPAAAERATGYVTGGISPLGQRRRLPTVVDASAAAHDTVFVSAGRRGLELELAPDVLVELAGATCAPIAKGPG